MNIDDESILYRYRNPKRKGFEGNYHLSACGENPFCGDSIEIRLGMQADGDCITSAHFDGYACSLCIAACDILMEGIEGMTMADAQQVDSAALLEWMGGVEVGRARRGCVDLPLVVLNRILEK